jgi:hypothetical protein
LRVVSTTIADVPGVGPLVAVALFGRDEQLFLVYVHHVATFTLFVWLVAIEHGRVLWPRAPALLAVLVPASLVSVWGSPAVHDGLNAVIKGPWYFVGLQEAFHWSPWPRLVVSAALVPLVLLFALRWMTPGGRRRSACALATIVVAYAGLTGVAWAFRGANWAWTNAWRTSPPSLVIAPVFATPDPAGEPLRGRALPVVMGRPEGCLVCHAGVTGLSESHDPAKIGCASCHLGNVFSLDAKTAHAGMHVVPGNLANAGRACGGECHQSILSRVERSLMSTNAGIVRVNRAAWDEDVPDGARAHIRGIGQSPADSHLRQLCASCHLGLPKTEPWPITEESRGGGCAACHLAYSREAVAALERYRAQRDRGQPLAPPTVHPDIALSHTVTKAGRSCQSCHNDPVALGYGEGRLEFAAAGPREGRWRFTPAHASGPDGLPADAWIGFLQTRSGSVSTRDDVRPLSVEEQRRVLRLGACLTCHGPESPVMRESLRDFEGVLARRRAACRVATW